MTVLEPKWRGVVIAEGLHDPTIINTLTVTGAHVSREELPVDDHGGRARWHLYWVELIPVELDLVEAQTKHGWYAHFWRADRLLVVYDDTRFELDRHDSSTWAEAIEHGLSQGLRREWLDFPTDNGVGTLET